MATSPPDSRSLLAAAVAHHVAGRLAEAEKSYRQILAGEPDCADALQYLGVIALQVEKLEVARELMKRAEALQPRNSEILTNLGEVCRRLERWEQAELVLRRAVEINPQQREAENNLGALYRDRRRMPEAEAAFRRAALVQPDSSSVWYNLGNACFDLGRFDEAVRAYDRALALNPKLPLAHLNRGTSLREDGRLDEAVAAFEAALKLQPELTDAHRHLGYAHFDRGRVELAVESLRRAGALAPDESRPHSELAFMLNYLPGCSPAAVLAEHERWRQRHASFSPPARHGHRREPGRRLRVGYVSPDFRGHAVGCNLIPLFRERSREQFEVFCYSNVTKADLLTAEFRRRADVWRDIATLSDEQVAALVREDQIDILVDLALHSSGNQLQVFARKPAPVQVTFAGYPGTTGLTAIDYRLTDPYLDPPGLLDACYAEKSWRLPHSFWCFEPFDANVDPGPLPAAKTGYITFGCLNTFCKVNRTALALWARVLREVPASRLVLLATPGSHREATIDVLRNAGVERRRVSFVDRAVRQAYFAYYGALDISLDSSPYNGHTSSLDSFWMGVPVVTLVGETVVGRAGWSQLSNLGLTELAAKEPDEFVRVAAELAKDLPRLNELRRTLRTRMRESPLMDAVGFTRGIEAAYRSMWEQWCAAPK